MWTETLDGVTPHSKGIFTVESGLSNPLNAVILDGSRRWLGIRVGSDSMFLGSATAPYAFISTLTNERTKRPTAMPEARYRIIGVPVAYNTRPITVTTVFGDDLGAPDVTKWRLGSYRGDTISEYPNAAYVVPGRDYWLIARGGKNMVRPDPPCAPTGI